MAMTYDCFMLFNELNILEIRLNILDPYVDYFVIGQSPQTFSGKDKPIYFDSTDSRFEKWKDKIIRVTCPIFIARDSFDMAFQQKEFLKTGLNNSCDDDIIYYGDVDEIWKPKEVNDNIYGNKIYNLEQLNYCYYLNQRSSERWVGTIVGKWGTVKNNTLAYWRATHVNEIKDAGWHFTNMGGLEQIKKKLDAYDHQEFNTEQIKSVIDIRMEQGQDFIGRQYDWEGKPFKFWLDENKWPKYLKDNKSKYRYLCKLP